MENSNQNINADNKQAMKKRNLLTIWLIILVLLLILFALYRYFNPPPRTTPAVRYDDKAVGKLIDKLENKQPLSKVDQKVKKEILDLLPAGKTSGVVHQSPTFRIEYLQPFDQFLVEILSTDLEPTKALATKWFQERGISEKGICELPVQFFVNENVKEIIRKGKLKFSPLPPGC